MTEQCTQKRDAGVWPGSYSVQCELEAGHHGPHQYSDDWPPNKLARCEYIGLNKHSEQLRCTCSVGHGLIHFHKDEQLFDRCEMKRSQQAGNNPIVLQCLLCHAHLGDHVYEKQLEDIMFETAEKNLPMSPPPTSERTKSEMSEQLKQLESDPKFKDLFKTGKPRTVFWRDHYCKIESGKVRAEYKDHLLVENDGGFVHEKKTNDVHETRIAALEEGLELQLKGMNECMNRVNSLRKEIEEERKKPVAINNSEP